MEKHEMMAFPYKRPCEWMSHAMSTIAETKHSTLYGWFMIEKRSFPLKQCYLYISFQRLFSYLHVSIDEQNPGSSILPGKKMLKNLSLSVVQPRINSASSQVIKNSGEQWTVLKGGTVRGRSLSKSGGLKPTPFTLPETNIAPENGLSQMETNLPTIHF